MPAAEVNAPAGREQRTGSTARSSTDTVYVIADLLRGGAQVGLVRLCELGFLAPATARLLVLGPVDPSMLDEVARAGPWAEIWLAPRTSAPIRWLAGLFVLLRMLRESDASLVILSLEPANLVGRLVRPFFPRSLFCSFEHNTKIRRWLYRQVLPLLSGGIDAVLSDSPATRHAMEFLYRSRPDRLVLDVPLFAVDPQIEPKRTYAAGSPFRILSVGRLVPNKDQMLLLDVLAALQRCGLPVACEIVGEGPLRADLERRSAEIGLDRVVAMVGEDRHWQRRASSFDLYLQTSEHEGACLTVLEAMTAGLPVVATAVGEIGAHLACERGWPCRSRSPAAIADAVRALAADEALRARMGQRARAWVETEHSPAAVRSRLQQARSLLVDRLDARRGIRGQKHDDDVVAA